MPRLLLASVPFYLHGSALYKTLNQEETENFFDIPDECFKENDTLSSGNCEEFAQLLRVIQFWGIDDIPLSVICYCRDCRHGKGWIQDALTILGNQSPIFLALKYVLNDTPDNSIVHVIHLNRRDILEYWYDTTPKHSTFGLSATNVAARLGKLEVLIQLHERGFYWDNATYSMAAEYGQLSCLVYLHQSGCRWDYTATTRAAAGGHIHCLRFMRENGLTWNWTECTAAAGNGQLECLTYLHEHGCSWDAEVTLQAAKHGNLSCLLYALTNGCPLHSDACDAASKQGNLACLELLRLHGSPLTETTMTAAVAAGQLEFVTHLLAHGCPVDTTASDEAARQQSDAFLRCLISNGCTYSDQVLIIAAQAGSLDCLKYLIEEEGVYMGGDGAVLNAAFSGRHVACIRYLRDVGCPTSSYLSFDTTDSLHLQCLRRGGEVDPLRVRDTLDGQLLSCLKCMIETGCCVVDLRHNQLLGYVAKMKLSGCTDFLLEEVFTQEVAELKGKLVEQDDKAKYNVLERIWKGSLKDSPSNFFIFYKR